MSPAQKKWFRAAQGSLCVLLFFCGSSGEAQVSRQQETRWSELLGASTDYFFVQQLSKFDIVDREQLARFLQVTLRSESLWGSFRSKILRKGSSELNAGLKRWVESPALTGEDVSRIRYVTLASEPRVVKMKVEKTECALDTGSCEKVKWSLAVDGLGPESFFEEFLFEVPRALLIAGGVDWNHALLLMSSATERAYTLDPKDRGRLEGRLALLRIMPPRLNDPSILMRRRRITWSLKNGMRPVQGVEESCRVLRQALGTLKPSAADEKICGRAPTPKN